MNKEEIEIIRSAISHDIRGATTITKGYAEFARNNKFGSLNKELVDAFYSIERASNRITAVATNLNEYIRFRFQNAELSIQNVDSYYFLEKACKTVELDALKKNIVIKKELEERTFCGDTQALEIIFSNILRNAIEFSSHNKVVLVRNDIHADRVDFSVIDSGAGLSDLDINLLWTDPMKISSQQGIKGTSLGLRVSKMLVEKQNGTIEVKTKGLGNGIIVKLSFGR